MKLIYIWLSYVIIGTILLIGKAITCRLLGIHHKHYQIGFSPSFIEFSLFKVRFSIGIIVPLPWLFKTYEIHDNKKKSITPIWIRREISTIKRIIGIIGGVILLYVISLLIYSINFHTTKNTYLSLDDINKNGIYVDSIGEKLGLKSGDKIVKINGDTPDNYSELLVELYSNESEVLTLIRNDSLIEVELDNEFSLGSMASYDNKIIYPVFAKYPLTVDSVLIGGGAYNSGLVAGDKIVTINGDTVFYYQDFVNILSQNNNDSILLGINKSEGNDLISLIVNPDYDGKIGVIIKQTLTYTTEDKTMLQSLNSGNVFIKNYLKQFKRLFIKEPEIRHIGGFQSIGSLFPQQRDIWRIISMIMLIYICWSWIPTPITEGRYLLAILIDKIIRLPKNAPSWISWILFISLILIANFIDIMRFI